MEQAYYPGEDTIGQMHRDVAIGGMWSELRERPAVYPAFAWQAVRGTHCLTLCSHYATVGQTV